MRLRPGWIIKNKHRGKSPEILVLKYRQGRKHKWFQVEGILFSSKEAGRAKSRFNNYGLWSDLFEVVNDRIEVSELLTSDNKLLREVGKLLVSGTSYNRIYSKLLG